MARLSIILLGAPRFELDGVPLDITLRKAVALLAYLALTGVPHTRDALATMFWPEADQDRARGALRYTLAQLKAALGAGWLHASREQIGLVAHPDLSVDVAHIAALLAQVQAHDHPFRQACAMCVPLLEQAMTLQRGTLLAGFTLPDSPHFDDWLFFEAERLQRLQVDALAALVAYHRAAGTPAAAIPYAQRWLALDPLDETVNRLLMHMYIASGEQGAARRQYATFATMLDHELGITPDEATRAVIAQLDRAERQTPRPNDQHGAQAAAAPPRQRTASALPAAPTPLLGRADAIDAIETLLADPGCRLLTLLGPGGSGKTRLVLAVAEARQLQHATVVFVPLAGLAAPDALVTTIAAAIGCALPHDNDPYQHLLNVLAAHPYLLVLDNLEQLLATASDAPGPLETLLDAILQGAPTVQLLVTSRVRVQLYEEQVYLVEGLAYPQGDEPERVESYSAVQLFVQRARRANPGFALTVATTLGVIQIVRLLAGQPLAIELAAAWSGTLSVDEIAAALEHSMDLLISEARNIPARHRSMRASYAFSWQQLRPAEQALQQALTVFRGGFTRVAALEIAGASPPLLQHLLNHSLLSSTPMPSGGMRYNQHELLRQFAAEQGAGDPERMARVRSRHAAYYLHWIAAQHTALASPQREVALHALEQERDNIQDAWAWAVEANHHTLLAASITELCDVYEQRGRVHEGSTACELVVRRFDMARAGDPEAVLVAQALAWQAAFALDLRHMQTARDLVERSQALLPPADDPAGAFVFFLLGRLAFVGGQLPEARHWFEHAHAFYERHGDVFSTARTLAMLGRVGHIAGDYAMAHRAYSTSLALYRRLNDRMGIIRVLGELAMICDFMRQEHTASTLFAEVTVLVGQLDNPFEELVVRRQIAYALHAVGRNAEAQTHYEACVASPAQYKPHRTHLADLPMLALVHARQQQFDQAIAIASDTFTRAAALNLHHDASFALMIHGVAELGNGNYPTAHHLLQQWQDTYAAGSMDDDHIFVLLGLTQVYYALGDPHHARTMAHQALVIAAQRRSARGAAAALVAWMSVLLEDHAIERAIACETLVLQHPTSRRSALYLDFFTEELETQRACLSAGAVAAARDRAATTDVLTMVDQLLAEHDPREAGVRQ